MGGSLTYTQTSAVGPLSGGNYATLTVVTPGVYLANFCINQAFTGTIISAYTTLIGTNIATNSSYGFCYANTTNTITFQGTQVITCTASIYALQLTYTGVAMGNFGGFFYLTRIG